MTRGPALAERCRFATPRLSVASCRALLANAAGRDRFATRLLEILSPEVTAALPAGWQDIGTVEEAGGWIDARLAEGAVLDVRIVETGRIAGLLLLHEGVAEKPADGVALRLGYLLARDLWGIGLGSELIAGLVGWCEGEPGVASLTGVVERSNAASARVLLKSGFRAVAPADDAPMTAYERRFLAVGSGPDEPG